MFRKCVNLNRFKKVNVKNFDCLLRCLLLKYGARFVPFISHHVKDSTLVISNAIILQKITI